MQETTYAKTNEPNINDRSLDIHLDTSSLHVSGGAPAPQGFASYSNGFQNINTDELRA